MYWVARSPEGDHVFKVNGKGEHYYAVKGKVGYPFFGQFKAGYSDSEGFGVGDSIRPYAWRYQRDQK